MSASIHDRDAQSSVTDFQDVKDIVGLSEIDAAARLKADGPNDLPSSKPRSIWLIAWAVVREPMFLLLLAAGAIYLLLGDTGEALLLLGFVFVIIGITLYQERKTERALEALRDLSSPRALVIREGKRRRIPGREVVCGDIFVLSEGDRVAADAVLLLSESLSIDESLLTGESLPVHKITGRPDAALLPPGGEDLPFVYSGTLVVQGHGIAQARATGLATELGKIGRALQSVKTEETPLQKEIRRLVTILAALGISLSILVALLYALLRGSLLNGFLAGIALAMSLLPEEFPVILTIFLALGAWRISQSRVLTRRMPAVESLGSATILCVDKTGTLTQNRMSLQKVTVRGHAFDLANYQAGSCPEDIQPVVEYGILASQPMPFDAMEVAFKEFGEKRLASTGCLHPNWRLVREYPLSSALLAVSRVWETEREAPLVVAAKGAPEAIFRLCRFDEAQCKALSEDVQALASEGLRVLGVARAYCAETELPATQTEFHFEFLGLVALADPIRPSVPDAIAECYRAGIRVVIITGDYPVTAQSIAAQIGLYPRDEVITGAELEKMSDAELQRRIGTTNIFARVVPAQKLRLVTALKTNGEVVAMSGDGVNDAPALKAAHIGIAMGGRGTDVAREAASLVLLDDDFSSIVRAVRMGRRIFDNLKKSMAYTLAVHVPIAGISLIPIVFNWPLVLLPVHIVFLELIIDPACSMAFEAEKEEEGVMSRPPRHQNTPILDRRTVGIAALQGMIVLAIVAGMFAWALQHGSTEIHARALAYATLIMANLSLIWTNRSWTSTPLHTFRSRNVALWLVTGSGLALLSAALYIPFISRLFRITSLGPKDAALCAAAGFSSILWFEAWKVFHNRKR